LPVSTVLMLRSIADIARSEGEDIKSIETKLACLEVFALGGRSPSDDAAEAGYFAVRAILAREVSEVAKFITQKGLVEEAPVVVRLIAAIASRFGTAVSEKVAAQIVPVVGGVGGALVNILFIDHFQDVARDISRCGGSNEGTAQKKSRSCIARSRWGDQGGPTEFRL